MKYLKLISASILMFLVGVMATAVVVAYHTTPVEFTKYDLSQPSRVSAPFPVTAKKAIKRSVGSAVHIVSLTDDGQSMVLSSGTYLSYNDRYYVLSVAHGIAGPCKEVGISYFANFIPCKKILTIDKTHDYVLMEVEKIENRRPIKLPGDIANPRTSYALMDSVYYTGYPNSGGPLTFGGTISGFDSQGYIYMHSYAWSGSSGAGVFDKSGRLVGIIMALDVGYTEYGLDVLEDIVIVVPSYLIKWDKVFHNTP